MKKFVIDIPMDSNDFSMALLGVPESVVDAMESMPKDSEEYKKYDAIITAHCAKQFDSGYFEEFILERPDLPAPKGLLEIAQETSKKRKRK